MIGFVPQRARLFSRSLLANIVYGSDKSIDNVQTFMDMHDIQFGTHELGDDVGKNGSLISGGQRQLVLLMRLLFRDTPIMLLDEPSASIDVTLREKFVTLLSGAVVNGKTIVLVSHDLEFIEQLVNNGAIVHRLGKKL